MTIIIRWGQDFERTHISIHTKNLLFQGAKPSKVALPCSRQLLKSKIQRGSEVLLQERCVLRGEVYPSICTSPMAVWRRNLAGTSVSTTSACCPGTAILRWGWEGQVVVCPHPDQLLSPPPSRGGLLNGPGLLLGWFRAQIIWVDGPFYYTFAQFSTMPCRNAPFGVFSHVLFMFMSYKTIISKYIWNRFNSKCICA
jgi:hypothetical protein